MRTNVFETMYNIAFTELSDPKTLSNALDNNVLNMSIDNTVRVAESEYIEAADSVSFELVDIDDNNAVGRITISGTEKQLRNNDSHRILEQRVIGDKIYYLFTCIKALPKEKDEKVINISQENNIESQLPSFDTVIKIDSLSRMIDYYLDCILNDTIVMTHLNERDKMTSNDPVIVIAKAILLYNSLIGQETFKLSDNNEEMWKIVTDMLLTENIRTDWLQNNQFKSNDKLSIFRAQLELKDEIFRLCNEVRSDDQEKFKENYMNLFTKGDIYKLANYRWIPVFLAVGTNAFSTEALNITWKNYI